MYIESNVWCTKHNLSVSLILAALFLHLVLIFLTHVDSSSSDSSCTSFLSWDAALHLYLHAFTHTHIYLYIDTYTYIAIYIYKYIRIYISLKFWIKAVRRHFHFGQIKKTTKEDAPNQLNACHWSERSYCISETKEFFEIAAYASQRHL